jgi:hypothetical protein
MEMGRVVVSAEAKSESFAALSAQPDNAPSEFVWTMEEPDHADWPLTGI